LAGLPRQVKVYALGVALLGVAAIAAWQAVWPDQWRPAAAQDWALPVVFAALTAAALLFPLRLSPSFLLTVDLASSFAALLLLGPLMAMLAVGAGTAAANAIEAARGRRDRWNVLFNVGSNVLAIGLAGIGAYGLGGFQVPLAFDDARAVLAALTGGVVMDLTNSLAVSIAVGLQRRQSPLALWLQSERIDAMPSSMLLLAGLLIALLAPQHPWALVVLVLLTILAYRTLEHTIHLVERERAVRDEAERARAEAETALRVRDEFLSAATHELRTPMTALLGAAQLARRLLARQGTLTPEQTERTLHVVERQARRSARLVEHLVFISLLDTGALQLLRERVDLAQVVREAVERARGAVDQHELVWQGGQGGQGGQAGQGEQRPVMAEVDAPRIQQLVANLLDNAVRFSPEGTPVEIDVVEQMGVDGRGSRAVRIAVRDHGVGIPPDQRPYVFDRHHQAHAGQQAGYRSGLGLGLYVSRTIAELHGGTIELQAPDDGGTRVVVTLPA
jgi:signal transduction histidine kinase